VVCFEHVGAPRRWSAEDRTFAGSVADLLSLSMEDAELQRSEDGVRLLLEASKVLAASIDYRTTLTNVARLAVPTLSDWCIVSVIENGDLKRVAIAHMDPEKERIVEELERRYPEARSTTPAVHVIRSGEPEYVPEMTEEVLRERTVDRGHRALMEQLGVRSYMALPLVARGAPLGAITFGSGTRVHHAQDLALAKDLATRSAIAIENARLHAEVVEANRGKSSFLSVMSHELRTPLSAITGYACLLKDGIPEAPTPAQKVQLDRILANTAELLRVIDEILEFSRLEAGEERFHFEKVELGKLVDEVASGGEVMAKERGLRFEVHTTGEKERLRTDPDKVRHILLNLISNAVKFTREGGVELDAELHDGVATFRVSDTGIGIQAEQRDRIFDAFYQVEDALTREVGGTGIGLAVVRGLSRLLGGDVTVASTPGEGSTFTVTIPDKPAAEVPDAMR
jgi:signal transduction histidine kinase